MNLRAAIFTQQSSRKPLFALVFLAFGCYAAYKAANFVINDDLQGLAIVGVAFVVSAAVLAMLKNWRNGVYVFLGWLLFEDFVRKYMGNNMFIYFGKDLLVLVVYISFYISVRAKKEKTFRPPFLVPLLIFIWFGAIQMFNPGSPHILYGPLGFRVYFLYVPLLFVGYAFLDSEAQLRRFFQVNIVLGLVIVSLGIAQAILGHTFLNPQTMDVSIESSSNLYRVSPVTGVLIHRPAATFVSHGRYVDFMQIMWLMVLGFSAYLLLRHRRGRQLAFAALAVTTAGSFLSASRGLFMWTFIDVVVVSAAFLWGAPWRQKEVVRTLRTFQRFALGMILAVAALFLAFPDELGARLELYSETISPSSGASDLSRRTWAYPIDNFLGAFDNPRWLYGYGIGTNSLGTQYIARFFKAQLTGVGVESGFGTLVLELGIGGLFLWIFMASAIVISAWRVVKKLRGSPWFPLGFVVLWYAFVLLFLQMFAGIQAYEDFMMNAYLWLLLGILFRLPNIALSAEFAAAESAAQVRHRWMT